MQALFSFFLKGLAIGLIGMIPGITAATATFVLGSYSQILAAVKSLNLTALKYLFGQQWRELSEYVPWKLLLLMPLGAACAVFLLPHFLPLSLWMDLYKPFLYSGFCGMILGGLGFTLVDHRGGGLLGIILFFGGIAASVALLMLPITPLPGDWTLLFVHGVAAVFTTAVPGLADGFSGRPLTDYTAVHYYADHGYWPALILFGLGLAIGIALLVNLHALAQRKFAEQTLSLLMGLTAGTILQLMPLRFLGEMPEESLPLLGAAFAVGAAISGLLQFLQRRTLA